MTPRVIFSGVPLPVCDRCDAVASRYVDGHHGYEMLCSTCCGKRPWYAVEHVKHEGRERKDTVEMDVAKR